MGAPSRLSAAESSPVHHSALRGPEGRPIGVLVVDDEETLSELVGLALRYEGWDGRAAADGLSVIVVRMIRAEAYGSVLGEEQAVIARHE